MTAQPNPILEEFKTYEQSQALRTPKGPDAAELDEQIYYDTCASLLLDATLTLQTLFAEARATLPDEYGAETMAQLRRKCVALHELFSNLGKSRTHQFSRFIGASRELRATVQVVHQKALSAVNYVDKVRKKPSQYQLGTMEARLLDVLIALRDVKALVLPEA